MISVSTIASLAGGILFLIITGDVQIAIAVFSGYLVGCLICSTVFSLPAFIFENKFGQ
jgi:hypothetical protein